jgi:hypothetical protein
MARNIKVIKNADNPETPEVLADSIIRIANAFEKLMTSELRQDALVALLRDMPGMMGIGKGEVNLILNNLRKLKSYYIRSK